MKLQKMALGSIILAYLETDAVLIPLLRGIKIRY